MLKNMKPLLYVGVALVILNVLIYLFIGCSGQPCDQYDPQTQIEEYIICCVETVCGGDLTDSQLIDDDDFMKCLNGCFDTAYGIINER